MHSLRSGDFCWASVIVRSVHIVDGGRLGLFSVDLQCLPWFSGQVATSYPACRTSLQLRPRLAYPNISPYVLPRSLFRASQLSCRDWPEPASLDTSSESSYFLILSVLITFTFSLFLSSTLIFFLPRYCLGRQLSPRRLSHVTFVRHKLHPPFPLPRHQATPRNL